MMKRYVAVGFVLCAASVVMLRAQAPAGDAAMQADRQLAAAYEKGDTATVQKLLDAEFTWIDTDGIMMERPDVLRAGLKPLVPVTAETKTIENKYANGKVVWIQNNVGNKYAAHIWVQRPGGMRLLHVNEIATRPADPIRDVRPDFDVPCVNPCKEIPYKPISPSEQAMLAAWREQEDGQGHHDMHMGDNVMVISSTTTTPRKSATATGPTPVNRRPGVPVIGVTPALWGRSWDFGDAVVAIMIQPTWGGKAYWSSRIFGNHNGFWKMEESYHTTIQAGPRMTAVRPPADKGTR